MADGLTVRLRVDGARELLNAFRRLPDEANDELRDGSLKLSEKLAGRVRQAALAEGDQAALMAPTVKAKRDRIPAVAAGGTTRVGRHHVPAWRLLFAAEFGMTRRSGWYAAARYRGSRGRQYKPHRGSASYWFFATVERNEREIGGAWLRVADAIVMSMIRGG